MCDSMPSLRSACFHTQVASELDELIEEASLERGDLRLARG